MRRPLTVREARNLHLPWWNALGFRARDQIGREYLRVQTSPGGGRIAQLAERSGQSDVALSMYAQAAAQRPNDPEAQANYARALGRAGSVNIAEQILGQALAQRPREPSLLRARASVRLMAGQAEGALADYDALLSAQPADVAALNGRGVSLDLLALSGKVTSFLAPLCVALATGFFETQAAAPAVLILFFAAGLMLIAGVRRV